MVGRSRTIKCKVKSLKGTVELPRVILVYKHHLASSISPLGPKLPKWAQEEKFEDKGSMGKYINKEDIEPKPTTESEDKNLEVQFIYLISPSVSI